MARFKRRLISIPAVLLALPVLVFLAPVWLVVGFIVDASARLFRFPTIRLLVFAVIYLLHEWVGLSASVYLGIRELLGRRRWDRVRRTDPYRRVQAWWATSLLRWAGRLFDVRFDMPATTTLPAGPFIVLSRHASMVDAVLPAQVVARDLDRFVHYVIKEELRWDPNLDVFGHRLGNYFVARSGDGDQEAKAITRFAENALPGSALVIFPEGTYATDATRNRVHKSLDRKGETELATYARELDHLLPPKPAGTLALLEAQPELDVVVFGHVGLEGAAEFSGLRRRLPLHDPVVIRWWHHPRESIPTDVDEQIDWLNGAWRTLDGWVGSIKQGRREVDGQPRTIARPTNSSTGD